MNRIYRLYLLIVMMAILSLGAGCIDLVTDNVKAGIGDAISTSVADALLSFFEGNGGG